MSTNNQNKDQTIKANIKKLKAQNYPLIRDVKAENAIQIMADILEKKRTKKSIDANPGL